ncbi:unnamed protein product [Pleuronectes platessa]|uniref:Uncharacterized protein n=1 Tax=Pleuronectes platessa TaxID=8262 RepID=A0A9N7YEX9_PLEPL|nr:unnamed protein product [Pleuronectes platessa]
MLLVSELVWEQQTRIPLVVAGLSAQWFSGWRPVASQWRPGGVPVASQWPLSGSGSRPRRQNHKHVSQRQHRGSTNFMLHVHVGAPPLQEAASLSTDSNSRGRRTQALLSGGERASVGRVKRSLQQ